MRDPTLLLPFALPPTEHAKDLIASLNTPALATLIARATERPVLRFDTFAAALPHEMVQYARSADCSPPIAHQRMQQLGVAAKSGFWFMLQPVHLHVARDHLVLTDVRQLPIDEQTSKKLFESTAPLFDELGYELRFGDTGHWFMRADAWHTLRTTTPDAATGHNVDVWLPSGEHARAGDADRTRNRATGAALRHICSRVTARDDSVRLQPRLQPTDRTSTHAATGRCSEIRLLVHAAARAFACRSRPSGVDRCASITDR
ncbi:MAG: hypothetical protein ACKO2S_00015 [Burkholderiaceae bacterium]